MTARLHLPHPHILESFGEGWFARIVHHGPPPIVPDGHDWPEWHYPDTQGYMEDNR